MRFLDSKSNGFSRKNVFVWKDFDFKKDLRMWRNFGKGRKFETER